MDKFLGAVVLLAAFAILFFITARSVGSISEAAKAFLFSAVISSAIYTGMSLCFG